MAEWLILAGATINDVQSMVENHLKEMILKMFDPKKADTIFTEEGEVSVNCLAIFSCIMINTYTNFLDSSMVNGNDRTSYLEIPCL